MNNQWANKDQLADVLDTYYTNYDKFDRLRLSALGAMPTQTGSRFNASKAQTDRANTLTASPTVDKKSVNSNKDVVENSVHGQKTAADLSDKVCFNCGLRGHLRRNCKQVAAKHQSSARVFRCTKERDRVTGAGQVGTQDDCAAGVSRLPRLTKAGVTRLRTVAKLQQLIQQRIVYLRATTARKRASPIRT